MNALVINEPHRLVYINLDHVTHAFIASCSATVFTVDGRDVYTDDPVAIKQLKEYIKNGTTKKESPRSSQECD